MARLSASTFLRRLTRGMAAEALADQSDAQLVERFLADRSEAVFEALVRRHGPMVYRVCRRALRLEPDAEDAFQATFLILAQNLQTVRKRNSLASWLHGVAHRVALKARARAAARRRHESQAPAPQAGRTEDVNWEQLRSALDAELALMAEKWRQPLILCYLEGRTQDEAAEQLGWGKSTLRRRLEEARAALGRRLSRRGLLPAALAAALVSDCAAHALPPALTVTAVETAARVAAGQAADVPVRILALTQGVPIAMSRTLFDKALTLLLAAGLLAALADLSGAADEPPAPGVKSAAPAPAKAPTDKAKQAPKADALTGNWLLSLPAGFRYVVTWRPLGGGRFALERAVRFSGVYDLRDPQLHLIRPQGPEDAGFVWEFRGPDALALVGQPPVARTGQNYLGATLTRLPRADSKAPGGEWGAAVRGVRGLVESQNEQLRFAAGAPIAVVCRVKNFGKESARVYHGRRYRFQLEVVDEDGKAVPLTPLGAKELNAPERETAIKKFPPGTEISETFRLDQLFNLARPGNYRASFTFEFHFDRNDQPETVTSSVLMFALVGQGGRPGKRRPNPPVAPAAVRPVATDGRAAGDRWEPALIEGGFMFKTAAEFRAYIARAEVIAAGNLGDWDGSRGTVAVAKLFRGKGEPKVLRFARDGGLVTAKSGDRVLVLLKADKDGLRLHSFCGAPGLFRQSDALLGQVREALKLRPREGGGLQEEARAARTLERIKASYRVTKEPAYKAPPQYCLLLLGGDDPARLWLVSDGVTLYVDRNGNGDLTEPGEAVPFRPEGFAAFFADPFPGGGAPHRHLHIAVRQRDWQNHKGGYWCVRAEVAGRYAMYAFAHKFAKSPEGAPVIHLGGPLRLGLEEGEGGRLVRGRETELAAHVVSQYPGTEKAFVDVDGHCPRDVHPIAEIVLPPRTPGGTAITLRVPLARRC